MKLVGVKEFYNITRAKVISAVNCCIVISLCATATFAVDSAIDHAEAAAQTVPTTSETEVTVTVVSYPEGYDPDNPDQSDPSNTTESAAASSSEGSGSSESSETSASEGSSETSASSSASESSADGTTTTTTTAATTTKETTKETTKATTAETTKEKVTESEVYKTVYATTTVNVRKGPGTDYDKVKQVYSGDAIDVVAETSNGWYKTANGNYVKKSLTTGEKPKDTATPKPKTKATNTPVPKKASATATPKPKATNTPAPKPNGEGVRCKITFYGPQKLKDGTYSKSTASGTTCTEGRTVAADWSIYPKGTVIYIENDPLGGDGYYTVEDKGGAVKGYIIDIYAEDGETGNHATCYRNVYVK